VIRIWYGGLAPRRRLLYAIVAGAALLLVVALGVPALVTRLRTGSGGLPAQDQPGTVLLVPGYGGATGAVNQLAGALRAQGRTATVVPLPGDGTGDLNAQADTLDSDVAQALSAGAPSVDVVGYSAGGVVTRLWVRDHDGVHKARRIVTLGSPLHGTQVAATGVLLAPGACPTACRQLATGSSLLSGISGSVPTPPYWLSIWTSQDETVTPPDSARISGPAGSVRNVVIQDLCPGRQVSHSALPTDAFVTAAVIADLDTNPPAAPTSADCG
jgi:triacylglycerol esterase/lipase EstA (alpha/beta hydrolase family)